MKLIDRYVLKQFLYALLFVLSALTVVITLIDFTEKNGHFIQHKLAYGEVLRYYCYGYIPFMVNFITPIGVFVTTVFVTSRLAQRSEIIAMLGSGISFKRFLLPYLVGASLVTGCSFVLTGWVMAKANIRRVAFETEYINGFFNNRSQHLHIKIAPNRYFYVARYRTQHHVGTHVTIETIENNELLEKLSARRIYWLPTAQTWQLQDWTRRTLDGQEERIQRGSTLDISLDIQPDDFSINPRLHETLTLPELNAHIQVLKSRGADNVHIFLIEKYVRCMSPFAAIMLTCMGVVVSARKTRRGIGMQLAVGFILAFVYIACFMFAKGLAEAKGTYLLMTIWTPNIIFAVLGGMFHKFVRQ